MTLSLTGAGFSVLTCKNGTEALRLVQSGHPDLVALDLMLVGMDEMTVLKKIRELGIRVPVIILTNLSADQKIMGGVVRDEPSYYVVKSDSPIEDIVEKVKTTLGV
ncbi:MAG: response regulator [bacterium]|nr:response regulator [bacterium]